MNTENAETATKSGVEKIIAHLQANQADIGAIVIAIAPLPGKKIKDEDGDHADGVILCADVIFADDEKQRSSVRFRTMLTEGLALQVRNRLVEPRAGLFG